VKPHASPFPETLEFVRETLIRKGIRIRGEGRLDGDTIRRQGIIDRHYAAIADYAVLRPPEELGVTEPARQRFAEAFGVPWLPGEARNAARFQEETGLTGLALNALWAATRYVKLAPGLYAARLPRADGALRTVINGFYPCMREKFTRPGAVVLWLDVAFSAAVLPWRAFRQEVVGATDPAAAETTSIRGRLFREPARFGLPGPLTTQDNGVHASAGPLEGAKERLVWLGPEAPATALEEGLRREGVSPSAWETLLGNPTIERAGRRGPAFDLLEDTDAEEAVAVLLGHLRRTVAAGPP
jgi:hypothetical protein